MSNNSNPYRGYVDPNFPNPNGPGDARIIIYGYTPNTALCILSITLFSILFLVHALQTFLYRHYSFIPLTISLLLETVGYTFRLLSSTKNPYRINYFVVQYFLIVTAPVLISASIYVCLTHVIAWAEESEVRMGGSWWLRKKVILWVFIGADVLTTLMQVTGAGMIGGATSKGKDPTTANNILLSGLAIQTLFFTVFLVLLGIVTWKIVKTPGMKRKSTLLAVLVVASVLVYLRTIFRLAETSEGVFGYLSSHEAFFGALEFAPIIIAVGVLAVWFPGRWPSAMGKGKGRGEKVDATELN